MRQDRDPRLPYSMVPTIPAGTSRRPITIFCGIYGDHAPITYLVSKLYDLSCCMHTLPTTRTSPLSSFATAVGMVKNSCMHGRLLSTLSVKSPLEHRSRFVGTRRKLRFRRLQERPLTASISETLRSCSCPFRRQRQESNTPGKNRIE